MNKTFHSIWSATKQTYVAVAEIVSAKGKPSSGRKIRALVAGLLGGLLGTGVQAQTPPPVNALPTGGQVSAGQASISQSGANMVIQQVGDRASINWQTFNVGQDAHVQFNQPGAGSVTLNRVMSADPSQIFGRITANGQVILTNPSGIYFGRGARVDVGGLVATTHGISDADFMAGKSRYERNGSTAGVVNEGELKAALGGYIALLAPEVRNQGAIIAQMGSVALAAGEAIDLHFDSNNRLTSIRVEPAQIQTLVENRHAIEAPGGLIILSAQSLDRLIGGVVRNSGRIEANGLRQQGGRIILSASHKVENTGTIAANARQGATAADSGPAGTIEISAPEIANSGTLSAGAAATQEQRAGQIHLQATHFLQSETGRIDLSAPQQGGSLNIQATGNVQLAGRVDVSATLDQTQDHTDAMPSQGGEIDVQAGGDIRIDNATLDASGGQGGRIQLRAAADTQPENPNPLPDAPGRGQLAILGNSTLSARGRKGQGGDTLLLGDRVALQDNTDIDASGATSGGNVLVGGDWQGSNGVYQATTVDMAETVKIDASATEQGDGGKVVLWSDIHNPDSVTTTHGTILARGGAAGGDGGQIETSGTTLNTDGIRINAGADKGASGLWLVDPYDYTIDATAAGNIATALNNSTSVTVTTANNDTNFGSNGNSGSNGNIIVDSAITATGGNADLSLIADGTVYINADITTFGDFYVKANVGIDQSGSSTTTTHGGDVVYWTNTATGSGYIRSGTIVTNGGNVWMGGNLNSTGNQTWHGHVVGGGYTFSTSHVGVALRGNIDTRVTNNLSVGGDVLIAGESGNGDLSDVGAENGNRSILTGNGDITLMPFSEQLQNTVADINVMVLNTTGKISIAPVSGGSFWSGQTRTYNGSMSGTTFNGSSALAGLQIENFANIGGWELGTYSGTPPCQYPLRHLPL
jgi:filamentous hemagglutinin family protein